MSRTRCAAILVAVGLWACPDMTPSKISEVCVTQFEKCKLPSGPLGVCQEIKCAKGKTPPCLQCVSQH